MVVGLQQEATRGAGMRKRRSDDLKAMKTDDLKKFLANYRPTKGVYEWLCRWYHFHVSGRLKMNPTELIRRNLLKHKVFSIQIGSNDGRRNDPIFSLVKANPEWRGIFVEPVPYLYERLRRNYESREGLIFENVAINDGSTQVLYWIDPKAKEDNPNLPDWFDGLGSFNKNHVRGAHGVAGLLLPYQRETPVKGCTFQQLLDRHVVTDFDLLVIDTEGYDWQVLRQVDLARYTPKIVIYEHKCLSTKEKILAEGHLSHSYILKDLGDDMFCLRKT
jgi:FkbM family methyltransferase